MRSAEQTAICQNYPSADFRSVITAAVAQVYRNLGYRASLQGEAIAAALRQKEKR